MFVVPFFFKLTTTEGANTPLLLIEKITRNWSNCIIVLFKFSNTKAEPLPMVGSFPIGSWLVFFPFILQFPLLLCDCKCNQPARIWRKKKKGNEHFFCWVASSSVPSAFPVPFTIHHSLSQGIEWQKKTIRCNRSKYKQKERKEKKRRRRRIRRKNIQGGKMYLHTHTLEAVVIEYPRAATISRSRLMKAADDEVAVAVVTEWAAAAASPSGSRQQPR